MKAYKLVKSSAAPLEKIAESTGLSSARSLSRAFKRHYKVTPNELRKNGLVLD